MPSQMHKDEEGELSDDDGAGRTTRTWPDSRDGLQLRAPAQCAEA